MELTKNLLNEIFDYKNGNLYWRKKIANCIEIGQKAGCIHHSGYIQTRLFNKSYRNHRLIFLMHHGYLPKYIDHIDNNRANNQIENLRESTSAQNNQNAALSKINTSGIKGVCWYTPAKKWKVQLGVNGLKLFFGYHEDLELAELVAMEARNKYHKGFVNHG